MRCPAGLAAVVALAGLAACETTGDPQQGGLFGWSENKAQERRSEKQARVAGAQTALERENRRGESLHARATTTSSDLSAAQAEHLRLKERLHALQSRLVAKTERLETASPTDAQASRARAFRLKVNTTAAYAAWPFQERIDRLRVLEADIDAAQARLR